MSFLEIKAEYKANVFLEWVLDKKTDEIIFFLLSLKIFEKNLYYR